MSLHQQTKRKIAVIENGLLSTYTMREGLMRALQEHNYEVYVLTHTNQFQPEVEAMKLKVVAVGSGNINPLKVFSYVRKLRRAMKKIDPEICLTFSIRPAIWGNLVARRLRIPVITNITGIGPLFTSKNIVYRIIRSIYPYALQKTRKVFFQNADDRELFINRKFVAAEKTDLIPGSGVDSCKFKPLPSLKKSDKDFTFLFIGRLIRDKGVLEFLEAAQIIKSKFPNVIFKIIGPLWHQNLKSNQLSKSVIDQYVSDGIIIYDGEKWDVRKDIADADCIVLPSYREGISNVLLEAAAMEKPCIATNVTGCKEIIADGDTGLLCKVRDSVDLAKKMKQMYQMEKDDLKKMGKKARQKVMLEFDKQIVISKYLDAIDKLLVDS